MNSTHTPKTTPTTTAQTGTTRRRPRTRARLVVPAAVLTGSLVFLVGTLLGVDPQVQAGSGTFEVTISGVIGASLMAALGGWGVRSLLARRASGGRGAWWGLCAVVLAVSLLGPLGAANEAAVVLLALEHLSVGLVIALGLANTSR